MEMSGGHPIIDIFLPTYRMEPEEPERYQVFLSISRGTFAFFNFFASNDTRFFPSKAKAIADKVIFDELNGAVYEEEDAKNWGINISDKIRESVTGTNEPFETPFSAPDYYF